MKFAILYYNTEIELGLGTHPDKWVNYKTEIFNYGVEAFHTYLINSQDTSDVLYIIRGENDAEFDASLQRIRKYFQNKKWRDKYLEIYYR